MSLKTANLPAITKDNPRLGETLVQITKYINQNVTPAPSSQQAAPPAAITSPITQSTVTPIAKPAAGKPPLLVSHLVGGS